MSQQDYFLRAYGYPWLPYTVTAIGGPADKAINPKPPAKPVVEEERNVRE